MTHPIPPGAGNPVPPPPGWPDPYQQAAYQAQPYRPDPYLPQPYGPPYDYGYGPAYGHPGFQPPRPTDGMAIASLVVSCVSVGGFCAWGVGALLGVLGAIFGHVARRRIRRSGAGGAGIALAGIIVGWVMAAIGVLVLTVLVVLVVTTEDPGVS